MQRAPLCDLRVQPLALCGEHDAVDDLGRARVVRVRVVRVRVSMRVRGGEGAAARGAHVEQPSPNLALILTLT